MLTDPSFNDTIYCLRYSKVYKTQKKNSKCSIHRTCITMNTHTHTHVCLCALTHTHTHTPSSQTQPCSNCNHREDTGNSSLDPTNQGLNRSQPSQSNLSSYYGLEAGRVSLGSKSISISLSLPLLLFLFLPLSVFLSLWRWERWWMAPFLSQHIWNFPLLTLAVLVFDFADSGVWTLILTYEMNLNVKVSLDVLFFLRCSSRSTFNFLFSLYTTF